MMGAKSKVGRGNLIGRKPFEHVKNYWEVNLVF